MVERAERKPLGADRDRSLAIWHPVQDVAHVLQLDHLRTSATAGRQRGRGRPAPRSTVRPDDAPTRRRSAPTCGPPTADEPLRVCIGGDSIIRDVGDPFRNLAGDSPLFDTTLHYEIATGLTRPDYYDWPAALADDMAATEAEVVFVLFGANDGQGIIGPTATVHRSERPGLAGGVRGAGSTA